MAGEASALSGLMDMYSVTSTANADQKTSFGGMDFTSSPSYNKAALDLDNPLHLALIAGALLLAIVYFRKRK
jgi:hypothetical protein